MKRKTRWTENEGSILSKNERVDTLTYAQKGHKDWLDICMEREVWECSSLPSWLLGVGLVWWRGIDLEATRDEGVRRGEVKSVEDEEEEEKRGEKETGRESSPFITFKASSSSLNKFRQIQWGQCARIKCPNKRTPCISSSLFPYGCSLVFPTML
jgi:hypothetical protein